MTSAKIIFYIKQHLQVLRNRTQYLWRSLSSLPQCVILNSEGLQVSTTEEWDWLSKGRAHFGFLLWAQHVLSISTLLLVLRMSFFFLRHSVYFSPFTSACTVSEVPQLPLPPSTSPILVFDDEKMQPSLSALHPKAFSYCWAFFFLPRWGLKEAKRRGNTQRT